MKETANVYVDGSRGTSPQPLEAQPQAAAQATGQAAASDVVGWQDRWHERYMQRPQCPKCGNNTRTNLHLDIQETEGVMYPFYTCGICFMQFTRKPRFETIIDRRGRI